MRDFGSSIGLSGSLLISHPSLVDPNFHKTVIYISEHTAEDGALGVVLNRPADRTVGDVLPEKDLGALGRVPIFLGGPVATDQLIFAAFVWNLETQRIQCEHHLSVEAAQERAVTQAAEVRAFIGYSGWNKGQLEGELAQHAWLVTARPARELLNAARAPRLWRETLGTFGPWFQLVSEAPDDLSSN